VIEAMPLSARVSDVCNSGYGKSPLLNSQSAIVTDRTRLVRPAIQRNIDGRRTDLSNSKKDLMSGLLRRAEF